MKFALKLAEYIDALNRKVGQSVSWLMLTMAMSMFVIAFLRYGLNLGWVWLQELVVYQHAALMLLTCGYAFLKGAHVRIDVLSQRFSPRTNAMIELGGCVFLLWPALVVVGAYSFPYVWESWRILEGSQETGGLPAMFVFKSFIPLFLFLLGAQSFSISIKSLDVILTKSHSSKSPEVFL